MQRLVKNLLCLMESGNIPLFRLFTFLGISFLAGIFIASLTSLNFSLVWPTLLLLFLGVTFSAFISFVVRTYPLTIFNFGLIFLLAGLTYYSFFEFTTKEKLPYGENVSFEAMVKSKPEISQKQKLIVEGEINNQKARVLVYLPIFPQYEYGDLVEISGVINKPGKIDEFDYADYLKKFNVYGVMFDTENVRYLGNNSSIITRLIRSTYFVSTAFEKSLNKSVTEPQASLASGLILGIKRNIPDSTLENFKDTGVTHIIALSG